MQIPPENAPTVSVVTARFTPTAVALHWLLAVLIIFNLGFGLYTVDLPLSPQKLKFFSWHKWVGRHDPHAFGCAPAVAPGPSGARACPPP